MADIELLARIDENVKYLRQSFDEHREAFSKHIDEDKQIQREYIRPLWEASQQQKGAQALKKIMYAGSMSLLAIVAGYFGGHKS